MGKEHFADARKMVSGRERGNGGKEKWERAEMGRTGEKHKRFGISGLFKKIKAQTGAGADKPKNGGKSYPKRRKQNKHQHVFSKRERANCAGQRKSTMPEGMAHGGLLGIAYCVYAISFNAAPRRSPARRRRG